MGNMYHESGHIRISYVIPYGGTLVPELVGIEGVQCTNW